MISTAAFYLLLLVAGLTGGAGDIMLAQWAKVDRAIWFVGGIASWLVCLVVFALLMRHGGRSLSVTFALAAVVHIAVVLGWDIMTGDGETTVLEWLGIVIAVTGVILIELGEAPSTPEG